MYCASATSFLSIFDCLYLMIHVSSGDRKGVIFLSFDSSFMWCEQFCPQEELFILTIFTLKGNLRQKSRPPPPEPPQYCQYRLVLYLNVFYIVTGISTPNFEVV